METENGTIEPLPIHGDMTTRDTRMILGVSLVLAVMGVVAALRIRGLVSSIFELPIFFHQFVVHDLPGSALCAILLLAALLSLSHSLLPAKALELLDRYRWFVAAVLTGLLAVGTLTVYHNYPLCVDEFAQLFQARIFAAGKIWAQYPPDLVDRLLSFTDLLFTPSRVTGRVISSYWPGFSLLETPFVLMGAPWLLNPLLGAGTLLLIRHIAAKLYPDSDAPSWAMLFALASPAFVVQSISYCAMSAQLFLNLLFTALVLNTTPRRLVLAGLVGSLALLHKNPVPHIFYALPWIVWIGARRGRWRSLIWLAIGYLPLSVLFGIGWAALRFHFRMEGEAGGKTAWEAPWYMLSIFSIGDLLWVLVCRTLAFLKLSAWAVPGLAIMAAIGAKRAWADVRLRALAISAILTFLGYLIFLPDQGHGWGYRYFHSAWGTLPLLACALVATKKATGPKQFNPLACAAGTLAVSSLVLLNGLRLLQVDAFVQRHLSQLPALDRNRAQVCFVRPDEGYYSIDLVRNDPFLREKTVFVRSSGPEDEKRFIAEFYPGAVPRSADPGEAVWYLQQP